VCLINFVVLQPFQFRKFAVKFWQKKLFTVDDCRLEKSCSDLLEGKEKNNKHQSVKSL